MSTLDRGYIYLTYGVEVVATIRTKVPLMPALEHCRKLDGFGTCYAARAVQLIQERRHQSLFEFAVSVDHWLQESMNVGEYRNFELSFVDVSLRADFDPSNNRNDGITSRFNIGWEKPHRRQSVALGTNQTDVNRPTDKLRRP